METATLAGGCFWCLEAVFRQIKGVDSVASGYTGGKTENPTYETVTTGKTGYFEAVQIIFKPEIITYQKILEVFFAVHDPTTADKQGSDIGSEYGSAILYHSEKQRQKAKAIIEAAAAGLGRPVVTKIIPFEKFYPAEKYHQRFYEDNRSLPYCRIVIDPKLNKLKKNFREILKDD